MDGDDLILGIDVNLLFIAAAVVVVCSSNK